ncbi:MAG: DNA-binding response regulator [Ignavibacteria bacterium CG22_combo_CG10-13_8_21_14_all_37_15]|nr:MAG: DNA-binding response regulator [Ignavibacteria bacterium CG22_combo_CG10-13_8_21_14_all_37_15]
MNEQNVTIHLFSEKKDRSKIASEFIGCSVVYHNFSASSPGELNGAKNSIVVFYLTSLSSSVFNKIKDAQKNAQHSFIYLVENRDPVIASTLAKFGGSEIYILPDELFKFNALLKEKVENLHGETDDSTFFNFNESDPVFRSLLGNSKEADELIAAAKTAAENASVNVLILGETGTGKGMLANAIHNYSNKKISPFVEVTCSAIPEHLLESELFGHEKGAFTDAKSRKLGLFELADNGTIFLDEIGELTLNLQVKLLRVLEKKIIRRVGGTQDIPVKARIISATHRDLKQMIEQNLFRTDLFYRLNVITIELASLRDRRDFILSLVDLFLKEFSECYHKTVNKVDEDVLKFLISYDWPGNIRELRNAFERAVLLCDSGVLTSKHFDHIINRQLGEMTHREKSFPSSPADKKSVNICLEFSYASTNIQQLTVLYAHEVLKRVNGNKAMTARILGISRPKLNRLLTGELIE